jgi:hypothetical protein
MKMNFKIYAKVKNGKIVEIYDAKKTAVCAGYVPHTAKYAADQSDVPDFCDLPFLGITRVLFRPKPVRVSVASVDDKTNTTNHLMGTIVNWEIPKQGSPEAIKGILTVQYDDGDIITLVLTTSLKKSVIQFVNNDDAAVVWVSDTLRNRVAKRQKTTPAVFKQLG